MIDVFPVGPKDFHDCLIEPQGYDTESFVKLYVFIRRWIVRAL